MLCVYMLNWCNGGSIDLCGKISSSLRCDSKTLFNWKKKSGTYTLCVFNHLLSEDKKKQNKTDYVQESTEPQEGNQTDTFSLNLFIYEP